MFKLGEIDHSIRRKSGLGSLYVLFPHTFTNSTIDPQLRVAIVYPVVCSAYAPTLPVSTHYTIHTTVTQPTSHRREVRWMTWIDTRRVLGLWLKWTLDKVNTFSGPKEFTLSGLFCISFDVTLNWWQYYVFICICFDYLMKHHSKFIIRNETCFSHNFYHSILCNGI